MPFDPKAYGELVAAILATEGNGERLMPLAQGVCCSEDAKARIARLRVGELFPNSRSPRAALSGLWLYFSCLDEAHTVAQELQTAEGSYWHGIMHRQEPDPGNSGYWFRRTGLHPVFPRVAAAAVEIARNYPEVGFVPSSKWDPFAFIDFTEQARRTPGSAAEQLALRIQRAEWQILFDYCAGCAE